MGSIDQDTLKKLSFRVWSFKMGEVVALMIHLGDRLGLYEALAGGGRNHAAEIATTTNLDERMVHEWLLGQAAAELIERHEDGSFEMSREAALVLASEGELPFACGAFYGGETPEGTDAIVDAFKSGAGFTYGDMGDRSADQLDRMNAAWLERYLPETVLPSLSGLIEKLEDGADVADIGCGGAIAISSLARRFPNSRFVGFDPSEPAIRAGRRRVGDLQNVELHIASGEDLREPQMFDFIMTLDCMHDMAHPDRVASAIKAALRSDGIWLIKDMRCGPNFDDNLNNPMLAMMYGFSVSGCLPSSMSSEGGMALGTLGFPPVVAEQMVNDAGFDSFQIHEFESDPVHYYYEVAH